MKAHLIATIATCALGVVVWLCRPAPSASPLSPIPNTPDSAGAVGLVETEEPPSPSVLTAASATLAPAVVEPSSEDTLAAAMHGIEQSEPARALEMARQGQRQWPNGKRAAEFARTEVKCLYLLGRPSEGRGAAEAMVNKYLGTPWALEVERETGAHPYVNH